MYRRTVPLGGTLRRRGVLSRKLPSAVFVPIEKGGGCAAWLFTVNIPPSLPPLVTCTAQPTYHAQTDANGRGDLVLAAYGCRLRFRSGGLNKVQCHAALLGCRLFSLTSAVSSRLSGNPTRQNSYKRLSKCLQLSPPRTIKAGGSFVALLALLAFACRMRARRRCLVSPPSRPPEPPRLTPLSEHSAASGGNKDNLNGGMLNRGGNPLKAAFFSCGEKGRGKF